MYDIKNMRRTNNDMFRQLEELTVENEQLKKENKRLREENRWLRAENTRLTQRLETLETTIEDRINKAVEEAVAKATAPLLETIAEKDREILRLKSQLAKDSSNSSKPSGSNGFKQVPNNREKSDRKRGGQPGHKGSRLNIPENLDELVEQGIAEHIIQSDVEDEEPYVSDWTVDLKTVIIYTEYRRSPGNRLEKYKDSYMLFMREYEAPFTNNEAERDLRHCKTRQKVSGCFRSWQGVLDYCSIRSLLATAKKRGKNLLDTIASLFSEEVPAEQ